MAVADSSPETIKVKSTGIKSDLIDGFNNLNLIRQVGLMIALAASVAFGFAVVLWSQGEDYVPLYGSLDRLDSKEVSEILQFHDIPFKVDLKTGALLVAADKIHQARIELAERGIPGNQSVGFELLDKEQPLGTSQFMESTRYKRSLEGELARTITSINSVRSARVHLAIPKTAVFVQDGREPSASVFLDVFPGRTLESHQIKGIANLVASSIPQLKSENVTIVDQKGSLLSFGLEDEKLLVAAQHLEYTKKVENDMILRLRRLLTPIIGEDKFKTEVAADLDFTEVEQAAESFNPDLPAVRSEQTVEELQKNGAAPMGIPGALTNQPPEGGDAPEVAEAGEAGAAAELPSNSRKQAVRNYELDRTVSYTKHEKGRMRRLTVAVVIDDKAVLNPETGEMVRSRWTQEELDRIAILVRDAVGFSAERGDSVNILNESFIPDVSEQLGEIPWYQLPWFKTLSKQMAGVLIIAILILGLLRPVLKSLAHSGLRSRAEDEAKELAALQAAGVDGFDSLSNETVTLTGGDAMALPSPEDSYEQQLNAIKGLVAEDPGRVAQVIKRWINEE
jgi:flagellar M-ring protein FliF